MKIPKTKEYILSDVIKDLKVFEEFEIYDGCVKIVKTIDGEIELMYMDNEIYAGYWSTISKTKIDLNEKLPENMLKVNRLKYTMLTQEIQYLKKIKDQETANAKTDEEYAMINDVNEQKKMFGRK